MLGRALCWLGYHKWRVWRVLKPHLYISRGMWLGCDLECARCRETLWWREREVGQFDSPFGRETEQHPNAHCPCGVCVRARNDEVRA